MAASWQHRQTTADALDALTTATIVKPAVHLSAARQATLSKEQHVAVAGVHQDFTSSNTQPG